MGSSLLRESDASQRVGSADGQSGIIIILEPLLALLITEVLCSRLIIQVQCLQSSQETVAVVSREGIALGGVVGGVDLRWFLRLVTDDAILGGPRGIHNRYVGEPWGFLGSQGAAK